MVHEIRSTKHSKEGYLAEQNRQMDAKELAELKESEWKVYTKKPEEAD